MEPTPRRSRIGLLLLAGAFIGMPIQWPAGPLARAPDSLDSTQDTLIAVGRRLSRSKSEHELTALATHGDALLRSLEPAERNVLATGYLRFRVDTDVIVHVAAPERAMPFWVQDLGFEPDEWILTNEDTTWRLFHRPFKPGWVGLGVNGLDRKSPAHYAVFVRPAERRTPLGENELLLDPRIAHSWNVTWARPGVSAARDSYRPFAGLPDELLGAVLLQPTHAERHSTLLATGRVWKTHVVATSRPEQVTIAFGSDPARELVFSWTTSPFVKTCSLRIAPANAATVCERKVAAAGATPANVRVVTGEAIALNVPNLLNDPVVHRHRVAVGGLEPDTTYLYSPGDGSPGGWGPWHPVKTGPGPERDVEFLYLGDAQTGLERWGRMLRSAYRRHPGIDFLLIAGDLVDRGNERTNWDHFFLRAAGVFDRVPFMPCVGNHEYLDMGPRLYRAFFELPRNGPAGIDPELVYQFEYGDAFFAMLDSTLAVSDAGQARRQAQWLDVALRQTRATWKLVIFHHPVYPSHPWRDTPNLREYWVPVFDRHHVDLVLQGHDHAYLRTYPLRGHRQAHGGDSGTTYVVAVSGDKFVDQAQRDYIEVGYTNLSTYQTIEIKSQARRLVYRAYSEAGFIVDELVLEKRLGHYAQAMKK
jgi:3',5'-cyclic AMP phosphodiesterase CpdA